MVEHRGLCNAINWIIQTLELSAEDRCLLKTPITFDAAGREFFPTLLTGGRLVIAETGGHRDSRYLAETIRSARISIFHCVPSILQAPRRGACLRRHARLACGHVRRRSLAGPGGRSIPAPLDSQAVQRVRPDRDDHRLDILVVRRGRWPSFMSNRTADTERADLYLGQRPSPSADRRCRSLAYRRSGRGPRLSQPA